MSLMDLSLQGVGAYVWSSYLITALVLGGLAGVSVRAYLQAKHAMLARERARRRVEDTRP